MSQRVSPPFGEFQIQRGETGAVKVVVQIEIEEVWQPPGEPVYRRQELIS
jgi:hypothetical protein